MGGGRAAEAEIAGAERPLFSRFVSGIAKFLDNYLLFGLGSVIVEKLGLIWRPIIGGIETLAIRSMLLPGSLGRASTAILNFGGAVRGLLGPLSAVLLTLDNARGSDTSGRMSLTELTGPGHTPRDVADYIHRIGWANVQPDIREYWRNTQRTMGPASSFIRSVHRAAPLTGGQAFAQDVLHRELTTAAAAPIVRSLTGGSGRSVADSVTYGSQASSDKIVAAVHSMGSQIVEALAGLGINITVPGVDGRPGRTIHQLLGKPGTPISRAFVTAPYAAQRLGLGYKP